MAKLYAIIRKGDGHSIFEIVKHSRFTMTDIKGGRHKKIEGEYAIFDTKHGAEYILHEYIKPMKIDIMTYKSLIQDKFSKIHSLLVTAANKNIK